MLRFRNCIMFDSRHNWNLKNNPADVKVLFYYYYYFAAKFMLVPFAGLRLGLASPTPSSSHHPLHIQEQTAVPGLPPGYSSEKVTT